MKTKILTKIFAILLIFTLTGCDVLQQVSQIANLRNCEFRLKDVTNLKLANVNFQNVDNLNDISALDYAKLTAGIMQNNLPLSFNLNLDVKNPNTTSAGISELDWILIIDDIEMTRGIVSNAFNINSNEIRTIPLNLNFNLKEVLSGKSGDAILNFALNLLDSGNKPTRFTLKLKPSIMVNNIPIQYPGGYFDVKTEFTGGKTTY